MKKTIGILSGVVVLVLGTCTIKTQPPEVSAIPEVGDVSLPAMQWRHRPDSAQWNNAALAALQTHGSPLTQLVPRDIDTWCPGYTDSDEATRGAFWLGFMSALAKHESTYKQTAVGGGGKWFGLLQISPATARGYKCRAKTGDALLDGGENLSCAVRIMAVTVPRDGVIHAYDGRWRGVSADWGPMRNGGKRAEMAAWLKRQPYCAVPK